MSSLVRLFIEGGLLMWPLLLVTIVGIFLVCERLIYWKKLKQNFSTENVEKVYTYLSHRQSELAKELYLTSLDPSLICVKHCFASKGRLHPQVLKSLGQQLLDRSKKNLRLLETLITVSPLLGILGTVVGIIISVKELSSAENPALADPQIMMSGLSQALITTALGLLISIIFLIFYNHFVSAYENLKAKLERDLSAFESLLN